MRVSTGLVVVETHETSTCIWSSLLASEEVSETAGIDATVAFSIDYAL